jgi:hypothetical protein
MILFDPVLKSARKQRHPIPINPFNETDMKLSRTEESIQHPGVLTQPRTKSATNTIRRRGHINRFSPMHQNLSDYSKRKLEIDNGYSTLGCVYMKKTLHEQVLLPIDATFDIYLTSINEGGSKQHAL